MVKYIINKLKERYTEYRNKDLYYAYKLGDIRSVSLFNSFDGKVAYWIFNINYSYNEQSGLCKDGKFIYVKL